MKTKQHTNAVLVHPTEPNVFTIQTKEGPFENKANISVIEQLAKLFRIPKASIRIVKGLKSKVKTIEIEQP